METKIWFEAVSHKHFRVMGELIRKHGWLICTENENNLTAYQVTDDPEVKQFLKFNGAVTFEDQPVKASEDFIKFTREHNMQWYNFDFDSVDVNNLKKVFESAVLNNKLDVVKKFVDNGYKITDEFLCAQHPEMWQLLKDSGADINVISVDYSRTAIITYYKYSNDHKYMDFLINLGCDPNIKDKYGKTVFDYGYENAELKKEKIKKKIEELILQL